MAGASAGLHELRSDLDEETIDRHRAYVSIQEELEAADWYDQRAKATHDPSLREILEHNRDEEKEHAAMVLEWLRRCDPSMDEMLRRYLFTTGSVLGIEEQGKGGSSASHDGSLGIGSLKDRSDD